MQSHGWHKPLPCKHICVFGMCSAMHAYASIWSVASVKTFADLLGPFIVTQVGPDAMDFGELLWEGCWDHHTDTQLHCIQRIAGMVFMSWAVA
jgi:hypothetical protein